MTTPTGTAVRIERTIPAPPAQVYRAWLDPEVLRRWFAPSGWEAVRVEVDERVGGHLRAWHLDPQENLDPQEQAGGPECRIVELVPDERIVLDWWFVGPTREIERDQASRLTVTLRAVGDGTHLTLVHDRLDGLAAALPEVARNVEAGWTGTLGRLATTMAARARLSPE
ncbi:SRPBCC domain-containing protein [Actinomadura sp. NEAU-AAG7]|uniref:SRPBCC family protein n=1 Tax=Actinomadura sp. NEAU-AAG7 TaxID=2839640 RepID=UPI001BE4A755|nr:SRPBCC domain-containing protein [Actinomadura sp. NEAU-AAG7]MBT2212576.1 SRPBCC domain-containing protein [Actinomadura sp. NEAU-AAG7]